MEVQVRGFCISDVSFSFGVLVELEGRSFGF
jgi:hypothetical protein